MDYIEIGCTPTDERCACVGDENYAARARVECRALINQLRRLLGAEPMGAHLRMKGNPHDFGTYYEVRCDFVEDDEEAANYAYKCEEACPDLWDDEARAELAAAGYPVA